MLIQALTSRSSEQDIAKQIARLAANFGDARVSDPAIRRLLIREWTEAMGMHSPVIVHGAVSKHIAASRFWPTVAEILTIIKAIRSEFEADLAHHRRKVALPPERLDRTPEEVAQRIASLAKMKQMHRSAAQ